MSDLHALDALFRDLFDSGELRRFARWGPDGARVAESLPGPGASEAELAAALAEVLQRRGLVDANLFRHLAEQRPHQLELIRATAQVFEVDVEGPAGVADHRTATLLSELGIAHARSLVALGSAICDQISRPPARRRRARRGAPDPAEPLFIQLQEVFGVRLHAPTQRLSPAAIAAHFAARIPVAQPRDDLRLHLLLLGIEATRLLQLRKAIGMAPHGLPSSRLSAQLDDARDSVQRVLQRLAAFVPQPAPAAERSLLELVPGLASLADSPRVLPDRLAATMVQWLEMRPTGAHGEDVRRRIIG